MSRRCQPLVLRRVPGVESGEVLLPRSRICSLYQRSVPADPLPPRGRRGALPLIRQRLADLSSVLTLFD